MFRWPQHGRGFVYKGPCRLEACAGQYPRDAALERRGVVVRSADSSETGHRPIGCWAAETIGMELRSQ